MENVCIIPTRSLTEKILFNWQAFGHYTVVFPSPFVKWAAWQPQYSGRKLVNYIIFFGPWTSRLIMPLPVINISYTLFIISHNARNMNLLSNFDNEHGCESSKAWWKCWKGKITFCLELFNMKMFLSFLISMDHSPIRQIFELGKFISTAGKSIINLVRLWSLVPKYRKMWKIQWCEVCEFCMLLYYARKSVTTFRKCGNAFPRVIQKYTKIANFTRLHFPHFTIFFNQTSQFY